jgi:Fe-S oxidoreductase
VKLPIAGQQDWSEDTRAMAYDNPRFWDADHKQSELHRVFEICNGCRLCFNLCPSFDVLFRRVDALDPHREEAEGKHLEDGKIVEEHEAAELLGRVTVSTESPVGLLLDEDKQRVVELCYECKLCYPKCPYVPPHEFAVDFPKLMLRAKMIGAKEDGLALRERFLGATDLVGSVMTKIAPLANAAAHNGFNRMLMEKTLGIAKDRQLPTYAGETFSTWWRRRAPAVGEGTPVALFATCYVNFNDPAIGKAAVEVLEKAGCDVACPEPICCGMPKLDAGDLEGARELARRNVEVLLPAVREGRKILSPGPSCTLLLRTEYPELVPTPEGRELADAVMDLSDFVLQQARARKLPKPGPGAVGKVAYHVACHNRVQNFGYRGRDLLKWAGGDVTLVDRCCGMDGTWGMKSEFFAESLKVAEPAARRVEAADPEVVSSDCPLAGLQLRQKTGRPSYHPIRILQAAYQGAPLRSPKPEDQEAMT